MSSIVTSILSSTVGLLWNKVRDSTAAKLNDGDVTDAKIREIVMRELNDIKTKLDGLSRATLLSSYLFLQEGVNLLSISLDKSKLEQKALVNETQDDSGEESRMTSGVESGILKEALELSHAMGKLKINSDKEFESAKKRFEEARKTATHAFCNEALSIKDRILAAKLRIVSEILECLESPQTAITGCLLFLKKLHSLPAVQEIFTVYFNGGVKSILNRAERVENVKSVMLINDVLFQYVSKLSSKYCSVYDWPTIELADRSFLPILHWQEVSTRKSMGDEMTQHPSRLILDTRIRPYKCAVNSNADVLVLDLNAACIIFSRTGERKVVKIPQSREGKVIDWVIEGFAVDNSNNVYVVRFLKTRTENGNVNFLYVLNVLNDNYNIKQDLILHFLEATVRHMVTIAINKNNNIIMIKHDDPHIYICENTGKLKHKFKFKQDLLSIHSLSVSEQDEIMMSSNDDQAVHIYSAEEGNLKSTIKLPEGHQVCGVAFHYVIRKIIVLSYVSKKDSYFLLCFSTAGELETSTFFCERISVESGPQITSHPSGPVAVVREKSITYI